MRRDTTQDQAEPPRPVQAKQPDCIGALTAYSNAMGLEQPAYWAWQSHARQRPSTLMQVQQHPGDHHALSPKQPASRYLYKATQTDLAAKGG
jgi:hypothetical protein